MKIDEAFTFRFESRETLVANIERDPADLDPWTGLVELEAEESSLETAIRGRSKTSARSEGARRSDRQCRPSPGIYLDNAIAL
ncbi:hypothetical protein [Mesorhizobium sp. M0130]|uniref:hypothetical protein n=1 Tax=Mesorhizobium sp. M0130 TaxID=2956887 RepID=UPI00333DC36D